MPYIILDDFKKGLDVRRQESNAPGDTLRELRDMHVTRGGYLQQRKKFNPYSTALPVATDATWPVELLSNRENLFTFSHEGTLDTHGPFAYDAPLYWIILSHPYAGFSDGVGGAATDWSLLRINDWTLWQGELFVSATFRYTWTGAAPGTYTTTWLFLVPAPSLGLHQFVASAVNWTDSAGNTPTFGAMTPADLDALGELPYAITTFKSRIIGLSGTTMWGSAINDALDWDPSYGQATPVPTIASQSVDTSVASMYSNRHTAIAPYGPDQIALFANESVQIWTIDTDWTNNDLAQSLSETGTFEASAVLPVGGQDVYYMDESGVRSLRARETIDIVQAADVGGPVDEIVEPKLRPLITSPAFPSSDGIPVVRFLTEPQDGRIWAAVDDTVYVFSYFPDTEVAAWSEYLPAWGNPVLSKKSYGLARCQRRVFARNSSNQLVILGASAKEPALKDYELLTTPVLDDLDMRVRTPFFHADRPAHSKLWDGFDVIAGVRHEDGVPGALGDKGVAFAFSAYHRVVARDVIANTGAVEVPTIDQPDSPLQAEATHLAFELYLPYFPLGNSSETQPLEIHAIMLHYHTEESLG
jgi:hypothetical protein